MLQDPTPVHRVWSCFESSHTDASILHPCIGWCFGHPHHLFPFHSAWQEQLFGCLPVDCFVHSSWMNWNPVPPALFRRWCNWPTLLGRSLAILHACQVFFLCRFASRSVILPCDHIVVQHLFVQVQVLFELVGWHEAKQGPLQNSTMEVNGDLCRLPEIMLT